MAIIYKHNVIQKTGSKAYIATPPSWAELLKQATRVENLAKFEHAVGDAFSRSAMQKDRQTDRHAGITTFHTFTVFRTAKMSTFIETRCSRAGKFNRLVCRRRCHTIITANTTIAYIHCAV